VAGVAMSLQQQQQAQQPVVRGRVARWLTPVSASLVLVAVTTLVLGLLDVRPTPDHLIFIYFTPTAFIAIRYGSIPALLTTMASALAGAYFLYAPRHSFMIADGLDLLELTFFGLLAMLASQVVSGFAADAQVKPRQRSGSLLRRLLPRAAAQAPLRRSTTPR
jgi:two-component system sensor histidine kinase KdpD